MMRACHGRAPGPLGPFTREEDEGVVRSIVEAGRMRERGECRTVWTGVMVVRVEHAILGHRPLEEWVERVHELLAWMRREKEAKKKEKEEEEERTTRERPWRCDEDAALMRRMEEASERGETGHSATVMASANFVAGRAMCEVPILTGRSARETTTRYVQLFPTYKNVKARAKAHKWRFDFEYLGFEGVVPEVVDERERRVTVKMLRALSKYERYFVRFETEAVMRKSFE
jgi:hypothetical protein